MHWITKLLLWLYDDSNRQKLSQFQVFTENISKESISGLFWPLFFVEK